LNLAFYLIHALVMKSAIRVPSASAYFRPMRVERFITFACVPSVNDLLPI